MADPELVKILDMGSDVWNDWRNSNNGSAKDQFEGDLNVVNLRNADLKLADLPNAHLSDADLRDAGLFGARLTGASLRRAKLNGALLEKANLRFADLSGANLEHAILESAWFTGAIFMDTVFSSRQELEKYNVRLTDDQIKGCIFSDELIALNTHPDLDDAEVVELRIPEESISSQGTKAPRISTLKAKYIREQVKQNLPLGRPAIRVTAESVLGQLAEFRERVRCNNQLRVENEELHDELLLTLNQLAFDIDSLLNTVSESDGPATDEEVEDTASWIERYFDKSGSLLANYANPEYAAERTVPLGIITGCGAVLSVVSLISSVPLAAAFGAGALAGKFYVGDTKPGKVTDKVEDVLQGSDKAE